MASKNRKFWKAYAIIMNEIDDREGTRLLFRELMDLALQILEEEEP